MFFSGAEVSDVTGFMQMCSDEAQQWIGIDNKTLISNQNGVKVGGVLYDSTETKIKAGGSR